MKTKTYLRISFIATCIIASSCSKYLEQSPDMRTELDSPEKVGELLATAYPQANYIPFTESMTDNVEDKGAGAIDLVNINPFNFRDADQTGIDGPIFYWNASYKAIAAANQALEVINNSTNPEKYSAYKGEALVARAYAHFMLAVLFAQPYSTNSSTSDPGIPYVTDTENIVIKKYTRGTVATVYENIEKDLLEGLPLLDDSKYKSPKYHFTKVAAHAFASRYYLFKRDYKTAIVHAEAAFPGDAVTSSLRPVNSETYRSYQYLELQAQYTRADNPANLLLVETPSVWGRSYFSYRYGLTSNLMAKFFNSANVTTGIWAYNVYGSELSLNIPKFREHFVKQSLHAESGVPYNMVPLFSSEEVLFNRAESQAMLGNYDAALEDINRFASTKFIHSYMFPIYFDDLLEVNMKKLLAFYKTQDRKQAVLNCILDFKQVYFIAEGQRWFDIVRHNLTVEHKTSKGDVMILGPNHPMRVFQMPEEVQSSGIQLNPR